MASPAPPSAFLSAQLAIHRLDPILPVGRVIGRHGSDGGAADADEPAQCEGWGSARDEYALRLVSILVILVGSLVGVVLPMALARMAPHWQPSKRAFFFCQYFGSGVLLSTAFMHLLSPAVEALTDDCLGEAITDFDWAHCICLITIVVMFYVELMVTRLTHFDEEGEEQQGFQAVPTNEDEDDEDEDENENDRDEDSTTTTSNHDSSERTHPEPTLLPQEHERHDSSGSNSSVDMQADGRKPSSDSLSLKHETIRLLSRSPRGTTNTVVADAYPNTCHSHTVSSPSSSSPSSSSSSQLISLMILEFGVVFHSFFIGLSLAGSNELRLLLAVLTVHQFFEGLGLGARLAVLPPASLSRSGRLGMSLGYAVSTPLGIVLGLAINAGLAARPAAHSQLANGVFDAISAGILVYTALVELLAHEFFFSPTMRAAPVREQQLAFACVAAGVTCMTVLAKWA